MDVAKVKSGEAYRPQFWRTSQYTDFDQALAQGGVYTGETCYGYTAFVDAMRNALGAATCLDADAANDLRVRVTLDGHNLGDYEL